MKPLKAIRDGVGGMALPALFGLVAFLAIMRFFAPQTEALLRDHAVARFSPFVQEPSEIVVVTVTEDTLAQFAYRSPLDRAFLAELITRIGAASPRAIGLDFLFDQPTEPGKDAALEQALTALGDKIVIADAQAIDGLTDSQLAWLEKFSPQTPRGLATLARDPLDATVRQIFPGRRKGKLFEPGFANAMAMAGELPPEIDRLEQHYFRTAEGKPFGFSTYAAHQVKLLPPAWFKDKFVLVGVDLPLADRHRTPFIASRGVANGTLPGVVVHAHALAQLVQGSRMEVLEARWQWAGGLALTVLLMAVALLRIPLAVKPPLVVAVLVAFWAIAWWGFAHYAVYTPVVAPSVAGFLMAALAGYWSWRRDSEERRFVQQAFSTYVSPQVVKNLVANPEGLRLGGERRAVTCVFTDLEGFTTMSERLAPEQLASLLNEYLDRMCDLFVEQGATIDKIIGDAIVGFFGAPTADEHQSARAVQLALAADALAQDYRQEAARRGIQLGVTRIGIHGGDAIVGNFGGKRFFNYTAMGDTVNTAARLESANKQFGTRLCVSGKVASNATNVTFRPIGNVYLKGKTEALAVLEPLAESAREMTYLERYRQAYVALETDTQQALAAFGQLADEYPQDRLVAMHVRRLREGGSGETIVLSEK